MMCSCSLSGHESISDCICTKDCVNDPDCSCTYGRTPMMPEPLPNERREHWCGARWRSRYVDGGNLHVCCYPRNHGHYGHCFKAVEHKACNHNRCRVVRGGRFHVALKHEYPEENERKLAILMFLPDHNRPRQHVALQFSGWELVLQEDGTYYANDISGG